MAQPSVAHPFLSHVWSCCQCCCRGPVTAQFCNVSREPPILPTLPCSSGGRFFLVFLHIHQTLCGTHVCKMSAHVIVANFLKMEFTRLSSDSANERQAANG